MSRNNLIQFRKGTLAQFNSANPTLASGEPGFATDANVLKVGDGLTPWSGLLGFSVGSGISSLNGLTASALVIDGGHNIQVTTSGTEIISVAYTGVDHRIVPGLTNINNNGNTFIQDLLFDQYGHVTGVASVAVTGIGASVPDNVLVSGDNISLLTNDIGYDTIPTYTLGASGSSHYLFSGPGLSLSTPDPTLYLVRGRTYKFVNNMGAHPFQFQTSAGIGGTAYTSGIDNSPITNATMTWEIRHDTPNALYYQCTSHSNMQGVAYILDKDSHPSISTASSIDNSNNVFIQDLLFDQYGHVTGVASVAVTGIDSVPSNVIVSGDNISLLTNDAGYATTGELSSVSGYLQGQINALPSDTNTFVSGIVYNTGSRDLVLTRNDGVLLTGDFSAVLHSGDPISFLVNDVPYAISGSHIDISAASSVNESGRTYVQDILLDQYGHITGINTAAEETHSKGLVNILNDTTTNVSISGGYKVGSLDIFVNGVKLITGTDFTATDGSGIVFSSSPESGSILEFISLSPSQSIATLVHPTISAATSVDNNGNTFIQDLVFDSYGHVIGVVSALASGTSGVSSETDPIFTGSIAYNITAVQTGQWSEAYSWGDHSQAGYATTGTLISVSGHLQTQINSIPTGHIDVSGATNNYFLETEAKNIFVNDLMFDTYGHVTGVILAQASGFNNDAFVTGVFFDSSRNLNLLLGGGAGALSVNIPASGSTSHPSIDAVASVDNSNNNFVQDLLFDTYGHVTGVVSAAVTGITSGGSAGDIYLTGVAFDTSTRNLTFSWNSGVSDITVNIPSSGGGSSGGGVLSSSGVNNILVASTGISIIHNTGTSKIQIGTTLNHTALHYFFQ
jgi:hypothetical protein